MAKKEKRDVLIPHKFLSIFETLVKQGKAEQAAQLTIAIIKYDMTEEEPTFTEPGVAFVWESVIKPQLEENKQKYKAVSKARSEAVGARYNNVTNEYKCSNSNQMNNENTFATDIDVDIDIDVDNDCDIGLKEKEKKEKEAPEKYQPIIDAWNLLPVPKISGIRGKRLDMLRSREREYSLPQIISAVHGIRDCPFLLGQNSRGWTITFDWFIKPSNFVKVLEGNYKDGDTEQKEYGTVL